MEKPNCIKNRTIRESDENDIIVYPINPNAAPSKDRIKSNATRAVPFGLKIIYPAKLISIDAIITDRAFTR
jgi:hypothetical protein